MKFPKFVAGALLVSSVALVAGCGGSDDDEPPLVTATSSAAASANGSDDVTDPNQRPTVATLNEMLEKALDPDVSNSEKTQLVEGSDADPTVFDQLVKARQENPDVTYKIIPPVIPAGPNKATVKVQVKLPDNPASTVDASIVYVDGRWKLSKNTVCPLVEGNNVKTKMCADDAASTTSKKAG